MKIEQLYEALTDIDAAYILSAAPQPTRARRLRIQRWIALAACLCLIIGILFPHQRSVSQYSAYDAASLFASVNDGSTNQYMQVSAPDERGLYLNRMMVSNRMKVYRYRGSGKKLDEDELLDFAHTYIPKVEKLLNMSVSDYEINRFESFGSLRSLYIYHSDDFYVGATQYEGYHRISFSGYDGDLLYLDGKALQINPQKSDGRILASLASAKRTLFRTFGVSFKDVKLVRKYNAYDEYGATSIHIYFYNEKDHALNRYVEHPVSDCIELAFYQGQEWNGYLPSATSMTDCTVRYIQNRTKQNRMYEVDSKVKTLSVREAEKLLNSGYVFGGHACQLCMERQEKISFENYDHVELTYLYYNGSGDPPEYVPEADLYIPFYAFYKQIGTGKNGNLIYAKTYVPAIALQDMDEYFVQQQEKHRS